MRPFPDTSAQLPAGYHCFDELDECVVILKPDGTVAWVSGSVEKYFGIRDEAVRGESAERFVRQHLAPFLPDEKCIRRIADILEHREEVSEVACRMQMQQDRERRFTLFTRVMSQKPYEGMMLVRFRDSTGQKQMEERLRESEEKYFRFFQEDLTGDCLISPEGRFIACNPAFLAIFGFTSPDEALASTIQSLYTHPQEWTGFLERLLLERKIKNHSMILRRRNGQPVHIMANFVGTFDDNDRLQEIRGYLYDDTVRRKAEDTLMESEERYRNLVEQSPDAITLFRDDCCIYANRAAVTLYGAPSPGEIVGRHILDLVHPDSLKLVLQRNREVLEKGSVPPAEVTILRLDGRSVVVESTRSSTSYQGSPAIQIVMRDITERRQSELERAALHEQLESAHREASLYLDILTHDIKNTENVSNLYADLLTETVTGEALNYVEKLRRSIKKSIEILANVSTIRRIHRGSPELWPVDLDDVIRTEISHFPNTTIHYAGASRQVWADNLLPEVFANLIGNAVKFGGPDVCIGVRVCREGEFARILIEDTGPGVPEEQKSDIFRMYEKRRRGVGEGLGLYLVRLLIERYGGRIWVEDRVPGHSGEGAVFAFTLREAGGGGGKR
ncbi:MAG: PAS domain S-box protein [Methanomicrobiaceae archaeon]|nr:PAS domain S-box protein [Methanomicrobiaceae archaeon]